MTSKHNTSILKLDKTEDLIAVPYDFDWSMLVDADYTKPDDVPDKLIKDRRVYKGLCLEAEELEQQHRLFNSKKELLIELIEEIKDLTKKEKQESKNYINSFYKTINRPSSLGNIFQKEECVKKSIFLEK